MAGGKPGAKAPKFSIPTTDGTFRLGDQAPDGLVVYFYPRDNTPGCTLEGSDFRDTAPAFRRARTRILGISTDTLESHRKFKDKMKFPFELLADEDEAVCKQFGVMKMKNMYGRKVRGIERSTFVIDDKGVLLREWRGVRVPGHVQEVLTFVKAL